MSDSNSNPQDTPSTDEYRELLQRCFPRAGYWLNLLPTHPFIHGPGVHPDLSAGGGIVPPPPYSPLDPVYSQTSQTVQPYRFSAQMASPVGNYDDPSSRYPGTLQPASFGPASGNGRPDNTEGKQTMIFDLSVMI